MLRFPTSIPLRPSEFNEFKESILSQKQQQQQQNKCRGRRCEGDEQKGVSMMTGSVEETGTGVGSRDNTTDDNQIDNDGGKPDCVSHTNNHIEKVLERERKQIQELSRRSKSSRVGL
ncbi:expressed protein, partial [Phakopsora pachyrhizi]